jgi:ABC-type transport system involved in cytochrome bd biosynthesis fused ATPase/permease subunit
METVERLKAHKSILAVAHTEKLERAADSVWRLSDGRLVQVGPAPGRAAAGG